MIEAKLKGEGIDLSALEEPARTDVVDLMAARKMSLDQAADDKSPARKATAKVTPIKPQAAAKPVRKRAWAPSPSPQHSTRICLPSSSRQTRQSTSSSSIRWPSSPSPKPQFGH